MLLGICQGPWWLLVAKQLLGCSVARFHTVFLVVAR